MSVTRLSLAVLPRALLLLLLLLAPLEAATFSRIPTADPLVALTFDDGPHPGITEKLLDILKAKDVKATFFVVGRMAAKHPDLVRRIAQEGHTVANHTFYHNNLTTLPPENMDLEWKLCNDTVEGLTGKKPRFARPPGGQYNGEVIRAARRSGLRTALWTVNTADYTGKTAQQIIRRIGRNLRCGAVILLHDGPPETVEALPEIIDFIRKKGYRLVSLDEALPDGTGRDEELASL
jgi:peptidoglycan/xylan/chitin deacetylase (PgdA/CDA1 family)